MEGHGRSGKKTIEILESDKRSRKVMEGHGRSRKVACRIIVSAPVPVPFLCTLDLGLRFRTWIWDLDLGLYFGLTITE